MKRIEVEHKVKLNWVSKLSEKVTKLTTEVFLGNRLYFKWFIFNVAILQVKAARLMWKYHAGRKLKLDIKIFSVV
jgi:hypothetical protein